MAELLLDPDAEKALDGRDLTTATVYVVRDSPASGRWFVLKNEERTFYESAETGKIRVGLITANTVKTSTLDGDQRWVPIEG